MQAVENVLEIIKGIIAAFKKFFEDIIAMFNEEDADAETDATV